MDDVSFFYFILRLIPSHLQSVCSDAALTLLFLVFFSVPQRNSEKSAGRHGVSVRLFYMSSHSASFTLATHMRTLTRTHVVGWTIQTVSEWVQKLCRLSSDWMVQHQWAEPQWCTSLQWENWRSEKLSFKVFQIVIFRVLIWKNI